MAEPSHADAGQAEPASPLLGRTIGGYALEAVIGEGGMATVFRGERKAEGDGPSTVAIKVLNPDLARDPLFVRRFQREAKAAKRLKHPATIEIFAFGVEGGLPFIVMELCPGAELVRILHHERRLSEARAANIMIQVLGALGAAHELGIVHRDLKPENIMLVRDPADPSIERAKVLDFGIAKILEAELKPAHQDAPVDSDLEPPSSRSALTMAGTVIGTPEYMSPEQSRGTPVDARSDLYTCGVLLYQMVCGRVPFQGETFFETALKHIQDPPRPMRELAPTTHRGLDALVLRALSKAPGDRHPTAREMQQDLARLVPELATTRHGSTPAMRATSGEGPRLGPAAGRAFPTSSTTAPSMTAPPAIASSARSEPPAPDSDDARTRVFPAAGDDGASSPRQASDVLIVDAAAGEPAAKRFPSTPPVSSEPPTVARPTTTGVADTLVDTRLPPPASDAEPPTVARPPIREAVKGLEGPTTARLVPPTERDPAATAVLHIADPVTVDPSTDPLAVTEHAMPDTVRGRAGTTPAVWAPRGRKGLSAGAALALGIGAGMVLVLVATLVVAYLTR